MVTGLVSANGNREDALYDRVWIVNMHDRVSTLPNYELRFSTSDENPRKVESGGSLDCDLECIGRGG